MNKPKPQHSTAYKGSGVYALFDVKNAKIYVGKSENIQHRFQTHRNSFQGKSQNLEMYSEPLENFVFVILLKMPENEYKTFGGVMELTYMREAYYMGLGLYNRRIPANFQDAIAAELSTVTDVRRSISESVKSACGSAPCNILHSKAKYREGLIKRLLSV